MGNNEKNLQVMWLEGPDQESLDNDELHELAVRAGMLSQLWLQRFADTLSLAHKLGVPQKMGYSDIFEFAADTSGMTRSEIEEALADLGVSFPDAETEKSA